MALAEISGKVIGIAGYLRDVAQAFKAPHASGHGGNGAAENIPPAMETKSPEDVLKEYAGQFGKKLSRRLLNGSCGGIGAYMRSDGECIAVRYGGDEFVPYNPGLTDFLGPHFECACYIDFASKGAYELCDSLAENGVKKDVVYEAYPQESACVKVIRLWGAGDVIRVVATSDKKNFAAIIDFVAKLANETIASGGINLAGESNYKLNGIKPAQK